MSRSFLFVAALALVAGCGRATDEAPASDADLAVNEAAPAPSPAPDAARANGIAGGADATAPVVPTGAPVMLPDSTLHRRLLRTADVGLVVDDVAATRRAVGALVRRAGGFVAAENENRYGDRAEVHLTLRIPAARFDEVLDGLTADGDAVAYRNVRVEDVTDTMVDLEARLRARRAVRDRYLQLLAQANEVGEVLAVEAKVAEVQESIEAAEGQLRGLSDRVALATIELTVSDGEPGALASGPPFGRRLRAAFADGLGGLSDLVLGLVALWPLWLLGIALLAVLRPVLRRRRVARASIPTAPAPAA